MQHVYNLFSIWIDYIWLHVRGVGQWTNRLYNYFEIEQERLQNGEVPAVVGGFSGTDSPNNDVFSLQISEKNKDVANNTQDNRNPIKKLTAYVIYT